MSIQKFTPKNSDLFLGKDQGDHMLGKFGHLNYLLKQINSEPLTGTSFPIVFTESIIYGTANIPLSGAITDDLVGAKHGIVQKIYHSDTALTVPGNWTKLGTGTYTSGTVNVIFAEYAGTPSDDTAVEYWIAKYN